MRMLLAFSLLLLLAGPSAAGPGLSLRSKVPPQSERPVVVSAQIRPQGSDLALQLQFDKEPWGEACKNRCANATLFVDLDASAQSGLTLSKGAAENGADVAIIVQGMRDYSDQGTRMGLRVKVVQLSTGAGSLEDGQILDELDHRRDTDRVQLEGSTLFLLIDLTSASLPSGRKMRAIYHPVGAKAVVGTGAGMMSKGRAGKL